MIEGLGTFALGVAAALVARAVGPSLGRRSRPLVRETIKQAMILGDGVRARTEGLQETSPTWRRPGRRRASSRPRRPGWRRQQGRVGRGEAARSAVRVGRRAGLALRPSAPSGTGSGPRPAPFTAEVVDSEAG